MSARKAATSSTTLALDPRERRNIVADRRSLATEMRQEISDLVALGYVQ